MGRVGELLVILAIVFLLFGSRRLKDFGSDLGAAIKGFKSHVGGDQPLIGDEKILPHQSVSVASETPVPETFQSEKQRV
ncbi:MAG: twin-arginine translocase TatA/TatE family subunit [Spongiibacteraceae bacterium]